jgi:hypothetical protein
MGKTEIAICEKYGIDLPLNKALTAVEWEQDNSGIYTAKKRCRGCFFYKDNKRHCFILTVSGQAIKIINCSLKNRKDGKDVQFKLVGLPGGIK